MIDPAADRQTRIPLDITLPVTLDATLQIFADEDYELQQAVEYLG